MSHPVSTASVPELVTVAQAFAVQGEIRSGGPYGNGHINDTFEVSISQAGRIVRYIFQRINAHVFKDVPALMENIRRVTAHAGEISSDAYPEDATRRSLTLVPTHDDAPVYRDETGAWWRCYLFIEGAKTHEIAASPVQAVAAARAFGEFQAMLLDLKGPRLHETIPHFHDTRHRFEQLRRAADADRRNLAAKVRDELAFVMRRESMVDHLADLHRRGEIPERVTHNDAKLNNVLIDDRTQEGVCVIDLDTVMPGLSLHDFGDLVRSATNGAAEDERDPNRVSARLPIFEGLVSGYVDATREFLSEAETAHLVFAGQVMTLEVGIRFLSDYLEGDVYFKTQRPGQNLDRARNQFALLRSLEEQQKELEAVVQKKIRS